MDVFTEKRKERENMHLHKLADLLSFHEVAVGGRTLLKSRLVTG